MAKHIFFLLCFSLLITVSNAQNVWTLQQCIDHALKNNINIKQSKLQVKQAEATLEQNKASVLPNLNASASNYYNIGKRIDQYTNQFADKRVRSDNFGINSNITLFNGFQQWNNIKLGEENVTASKYDADANTQTIILNIASAYLSILNGTEQLKVAENQIALSKQQELRTKKMIDAGSAAPNLILDIQSQLANEELQQVNAKNSLDLAYLNLMLMLDVPPTQEFLIVKPELPEPNINEAIISSEIALANALQTQASIKAAETRVKASMYSIELAKGSILPTLTLGGSIGSGYSGLARSVIDYNYQKVNIGSTTSGEIVNAVQMIPLFKETPYREQLKSNLNKSFGFQLNVPIFNGFRVKTQYTKAKINYENAKLEEALAKRDMNKNVRQSHADALAAIKKYKATQKSVDALQQSFKNYETRFNVGAINSFEYNDAKNKLTKANLDLIQAKYDYYFKLKVLEFYQGKPITL